MICPNYDRRNSSFRYNGDYPANRDMRTSQGDRRKCQFRYITDFPLKRHDLPLVEQRSTNFAGCIENLERQADNRYNP
jgi:hypothetical protein